jgi:anti-sigma factor RsiW
MKCTEISKHMLDNVLEELSPELQIQVNEHFATCEKCRIEAGQVEATVSAFKGSAKFEPSTEVYNKIRNQLRVKKPTSTRLLGVPRSLVYAFGAFLLGVTMTRSIDTLMTKTAKQVRIEARQETPRRVPFSDTVEFYAVPAKNLARL